MPQGAATISGDDNFIEIEYFSAQWMTWKRFEMLFGRTGTCKRLWMSLMCQVNTNIKGNAWILFSHACNSHHNLPPKDIVTHKMNFPILPFGLTACIVSTCKLYLNKLLCRVPAVVHIAVYRVDTISPYHIPIDTICAIKNTKRRSTNMYLVFTIIIGMMAKVCIRMGHTKIPG